MIQQTLSPLAQGVLRAAAASLLFACAGLLACDAACADVVRTRDGQWWPKKIRDQMEGAEAPSDQVLKASGRNNLDLAFDKVRIGGTSLDAANVVDVWSTTAFLNAHYRNGDLQGQSGYWAEAAASFGEAAESLKNAAKQVAMWQRVQCLRNTGNAAKTFDAAQELLDAFPKAFYFGPLQDLRARVMHMKRDKKGAKAALALVTSTPLMNARDYFDAKLALVYMFEFKTAGSDKAKYAVAKRSYEKILAEIEARPGAAQSAGMQRLQALVGIGKCYVFEQDYAKARSRFAQVIADKESVSSPQLLARAYTGLGDVKYAVVVQELEKSPDAAKVAQIQEQLTDAGLDYLRVAKFYVSHAGDELYPATLGVARVWATQFHLGGDKDCPLGLRAKRFFYAADRLLGRGEQRRLLRSEVKQFLAKHKEACEVPAATKNGSEKPK